MSEEVEITEVDEVNETPSKTTVRKGLDKTGKIILTVTLVLSLIFIVLGVVSLKRGMNGGGHDSSTGGGNRYTSEESRGGSRYNSATGNGGWNDSESDSESTYYTSITVGSESTYWLYRNDRKYFSFNTNYYSGNYYVAVKNCDIIYFEENNGGFITYSVYNQSSDVKIYRVYLDSYQNYIFGVAPDTYSSYSVTIKVLVSSQTLELDCFD